MTSDGQGAESPVVSCILVFGQRERLRTARKAVNQFVRQLYPRKQLVVVNATNVSVTTAPHPDIHEVWLPWAPLGAMRNQGLLLCRGEWVKPCWDDDDLYDPWLLSFLMYHRQPGRALALTRQLRVDINRASAFKHHAARGVPNTMVVPASDATFEEVDRGEDAMFWDRWAGQAVLVDNADYPFSTLSAAIHHGHNLTPAEVFMWGRPLADSVGVWDLAAEEALYLRDALVPYGALAEAKPRGTPVGGPPWSAPAP